MTHPLVTGPLPEGWEPLSPKDSATLTERLLVEQPRMTLLTQGLMTVIARHSAYDALLVQCDPEARKFFVTQLKGARQSFLSSTLVSVATPEDLAEVLQVD